MNVSELRESGIYVPYQQLSSEAVESIKYILLDAILGLISGAVSIPEEEKEKLNSILENEPQHCLPVWPLHVKTSIEMAGFLNGYCIRYADWGDTMRPPVNRGGHPSDLCAAMLALCNYPNATGRKIIETLYLGYQMWVIVQNKMMYKRMDLDPTTYLSLVVPIMAAACFDDTGAKMQNALNLSAAGGMILSQVRPADITNLKCGATGYAISRALWCYRMSSFLEAPKSMFAGVKGWYKVVADMDEEATPLSTDEIFEQVEIKAFPCCNVNQAATQCATELHKKLGGRIDNVERIVIHVSPADEKIALKADRPRYPFDHPSADHHIRYCFAVALKFGALTLAHYDDVYFEDKDIRRLIDLSEGVVLTDEEHRRLENGLGACKVEVFLNDGTVLTEECVRPSGYFVGDRGLQRVARLRNVVMSKKEMLEEKCGYNFCELCDIIMNLEEFDGEALLRAVQKAF